MSRISPSLRAALLRDTVGDQIPTFDSQADFDSWADSVVSQRIREFRAEEEEHRREQWRRNQ